MKEEAIIQMLSDLKHRIFPRPFERLAVCGKGLVGVEIGVYKAVHAESLLQNLDIKKLYLVDPYGLYETYEDGKAHYGVDQDPLEQAKGEAIQRLEPYKNKTAWIYKMSVEAAKEIPDNIDFVYIDGNHGESAVDEDISTYFPKVRSGGIVGGHDYYNGYAREHDGVVQAVNKFVVKHSIDLQVELPDWWFTKK